MGDVVRLPLFRPSRRGGRPHAGPKGRTTDFSRVSRMKLMAGSVEMPEGVVRPKTRGDCGGGERPCPFVSCSHHLAIDVRGLSIKENFPGAELEDMADTCALDVADRGGASLDDLGRALNVTSERARQILEKGIWNLRRSRGPMREVLVELGGDKEPAAPGVRPELDTERTHYERSQRFDATSDEADGVDAETVEPTIGPVWDLSQEETPARLRTAQMRASTNYLFRLHDRGLVGATRHPLADERLDEANKTIAAKAAQKEKTTMEEVSTGERIVDLLKSGPMKAATIGGRVGVTSRDTLGGLLRRLQRDGNIVKHGTKGTLVFYSLPGDDRAPAGFREAGPPRAHAPRPQRTIVDVAKKHAGRGDPGKWGHAEGVAALETRIAELRAELSGLLQALTIINGSAA